MTAGPKSGSMDGRSKVLVVTDHYEFVGDLHLVSSQRRESDVLNDEKSFILLTDVQVKIKNTRRSSKAPFVAVNKRNIICVIPFSSRKGQRT